MRTFLLTGIIVVVPIIAAAAPAPPATGDLRLRAEALSALYDLNITPDQLRALAKIASETAAKPPAPVRLPPKLHKALTEWCAAMIERADEEKLGQLEDKVDELEDSLDIEDPQVETTDAARRRAADVGKLISARQLASFIAARSDDVVSPSEVLIEAMDDVREGTDEDYKDLRDETVKEIVALAPGNEADGDKIGEKAAAFLDGIRKMSAGDFKAKRHELEEEARRMGAHVDAFTALHHWADRSFAEMLSNPELGAAISAMESHASK